MVFIMGKLREWVLWVIMFGVVLDLAISGILIYGVLHVEHNSDRLNHITSAAQCWDRVLSEAVVGKTTHAVLLAEATKCAKLIP